MTFCYLMTCKFVLTLFTCQVYFITTVPGIAGSAIHSWRFLVYGLLFYLISSRKCKAFHSTSLLVSGKELCSKTRPFIPCYPEAAWLLLKELTVLAFSSKLLLIDSSPCPFLGEALPYGQWIISSAWYLWLLAMHWEKVSRTLGWLIKNRCCCPTCWRSSSSALTAACGRRAGVQTPTNLVIFVFRISLLLADCQGWGF